MVAGLASLVLGAMLWMPPQATSTSVTTAAMLARIAPFPAGSLSERYKLIAGDETLNVSALVRGEDFRIDTKIDGFAYAMGRSGDASWRRTPAGTVRIIRSDVQGDDLDRWPRAVFGFYTTGCSAEGQSTSNDRTLWILYCRVPGDIAHYYFLDSVSGRIEQEVTREGSRVVTYAFDDAADGARPKKWHVSGAGGDADVELESSRPSEIGVADVAIPLSVGQQFVLPASGMASATAFLDAYIKIPVMVDGHRLMFDLDTGTTQILIDVGVAKRIGLHPKLGHVVASDVRVGDATATNLPMETVDLFGDSQGDGLLGNEFFTGHVVHLDYQHSLVELVSAATFKPPPDAHEIPIYSDEGMPIIDARFGGVEADRVALDSAGPPSFLSAEFLDRTHLKPISAEGSFPLQYLEGQTVAQDAVVSSLAFGPYVISRAQTFIEVPSPSNLDIPLDGVIGSMVMRNFEWWFDYDNERLWVRN